MNEKSATTQPALSIRVCVGQYALQPVTHWEQIAQQVEDLAQLYP